MTRKRMLIGLAVVAGLAVSLWAAAQGPGFGPGAFGPHQRMEKMKEFVASYLELNETQKQKAEAIFAAARQQSEPLVEQLKQGHEALAAAVKANKSDQELQKLAAAQGDLIGQLIAVKTRAAAQVYATLTPEQKAKADKLHEMVKGMFAGPFGH